MDLDGEVVSGLGWLGMVRPHAFPSRAIGATRFGRPFAIGSACVAYYVAVIWCFGRYLNVNTSTSLALAFALALLPVLGFVAMHWPLVVPFCFYILILPFDSLSSLGIGGTATKALGILTGVAVLLHLWRRNNVVAPPRSLVAWVALFTLMSVSVFWSMDFADATYYLQMYGSLIALYALLSIVRVRALEFRCMLAATVVSGVLAAGINAYFYRAHVDVVDAGMGASRVVISSGDAIVDPNELAFTLLVPFAITVYWLFNARSSAIRALMLATLAIELLGFAASGSRGGFIALGALFAYLLVRSRRRLYLATLCLGSVLAALMANPELPARFAGAFRDGAAGRSDIWRIGAQAFRDHWLVGAGVGNFANAYNVEYTRVFARYVLGWNTVAHSVPLTMATELGVVGLLVYVVACWFQLTTLQGRFEGTRLFELRIALEAACAGIFVAGFSTSTFNAKFVWFGFALMSLVRSYAIAHPETVNARPPVAPP
ncbi:MAG: hypothetical protein NVS2B8_03330 [Vulcanimicrobiaceae bacterium]